MRIIDPVRVFVGKHITKNTKVWGEYAGPEWDGNNMLVQTGPIEYVHIGMNVASFNAPDGIESFVSLLGNSDVPYAYAKGRRFTYMLSYQVKVSNDARTNSDNPYDTDDHETAKKLTMKEIVPRPIDHPRKMDKFLLQDPIVIHGRS